MSKSKIFNDNHIKGIMMNSKSFIIALVLTFCSIFSFSQEESQLGTQSITIYTDYTIVLRDASRVQYLPVIVDTIKVQPNFKYAINPVVFNTIFTPTLINAASLKEEPSPSLDRGHINLGIGNYLSPRIEVFYNTAYTKNYSAGVYARHHSAHGRSKNSDGKKVYNGFNTNDAKIYGQKFFDYATLSGDIGFRSNEIFYYGYDPELPGSLPRDRNEMESETWMLINPKVNLSSNTIYTNMLNYDMNIDYKYLFNTNADKHHGLRTGVNLFKALKNSHIGMDVKYIYHNDNIKGFENTESFLIMNPYLKRYSKEWQIIAGINTNIEFPKDTSIFHIYPNILIQHNISNVIIPYVSFKGYLEDNCIYSVQRINPYIQRLGNIESTNYAQVIDLGLKGNISRNIYFHINGNYSKIDNMMFFVNDISEDLNNKFITEYTNVERFSGYGEIRLKDISSFNFLLKGNYYYYSYIRNRNNFGEKPWHMPNLDISFTTEYQYTRDIKFGMDFYFIGERFAKEYDENSNIIEKKLSPIVDINLYGEYVFAQNFSSFINLNNLLGQKQYVWNNYHSYGFNVLLGIKYSF